MFPMREAEPDPCWGICLMTTLSVPGPGECKPECLGNLQEKLLMPHSQLRARGSWLRGVWTRQVVLVLRALEKQALGETHRRRITGANPPRSWEPLIYIVNLSPAKVSLTYRLTVLCKTAHFVVFHQCSGLSALKIKSLLVRNEEDNFLLPCKSHNRKSQFSVSTPSRINYWFTSWQHGCVLIFLLGICLFIHTLYWCAASKIVYTPCPPFEALVWTVKQAQSS